MREFILVLAAGAIGFVIGRGTFAPPGPVPQAAMQPLIAPAQTALPNSPPGWQQCPDGRCPQPTGYYFGPSQIQQFPPTIRP